MTQKTKVIILVIILFAGIGFGLYFYLRLTGIIKTGAEAIIGCQNSNQISNFFGKPGANLVSYNLFGSDIMVHELLPPYLDHIQKEVNDAKTGYNFTNITSYNNRSKVGGGGKSLHSWGIAIDINPDSNPYQPGNYGPPQSDIPIQIVNIFKKYGFAWGGDWPGERDPMHFEWYGAEIGGSVLDKLSNQKILTVATDVDGTGSPNANGDYNWIVPFGSHTITAKTRGYKDTSFAVSLACFSSNNIDITMEALPSNLSGSITGKVQVAGNYPMLMPASILLDGRTVGVSSIRGDYVIPNVHSGKHKVEAKVLFFPGGATSVDMVPGENIKDTNIVIGK
ncbi:MAG: M15 family metallopeptidase [Patescibacteria group bacterium]|nr:M15 family metallopeptidase [Patescibacteria group bacterium]